jgi:hypothetical protein
VHTVRNGLDRFLEYRLRNGPFSASTPSSSNFLTVALIFRSFYTVITSLQPRCWQYWSASHPCETISAQPSSALSIAGVSMIKSKTAPCGRAFATDVNISVVAFSACSALLTIRYAEITVSERITTSIVDSLEICPRRGHPLPGAIAQLGGAISDIP